ncbi:hypothetical protein [Sphingopyxis sp. KK2]|uniref:hypothetical protein n=1 Tax=Sphingopyxis sp. KK2 TaxID=1855727 RepID=UPI00097E67C1|nr:hypothetical protein [Sphingopyxis sp. KK2]
MDEEQEKPGRETLAALWQGVRPALPAVIGAGALTFLFAAVMPLAWVAGISWNLYLDRLSDFFLPPVGNAGRLALAIGMATIAALLAGLVALLIAKPAVRGNDQLNRRVSARAKREAEAEAVLPRRRADMHPDDAPRPPIRAGRDLPVGGLGPLATPVADEAGDYGLAPMDRAEDEDELVLADLAPVDYADDDADAPWLQPAEIKRPAMPERVDNSLGAMVARFEAGLAQRRQAAAATPVPANEDIEQPDFALEAALSTLQRMSNRALG